MFVEFFEQTQEQQLTSLFEHDRPAAEVDIGFDLVAFFQEFLGMAQLEVEIVIVGIRCKADLFYDSFDGLGLDVLLAAFLFVDELVELDDLADRRFGFRRDLHQVEAQVLRPVAYLVSGIDTRFYLFTCNSRNVFEVVSYQPDLGNADRVIRSELIAEIGFYVLWTSFSSCQCFLFSK